MKCKSKFNSRISRGDTLDVLIRKLDNLNVKNHDIIDQVVNYYAKVIALRIKFAEEEGMLYLPVVSSSINNEIKITYLHEIDVQTEGMTYEKTYENLRLISSKKSKKFKRIQCLPYKNLLSLTF